MTYPFPNVNGATAKVWEYISNFIHVFLGMSLLIHAGVKVNPDQPLGVRSLRAEWPEVLIKRVYVCVCVWVRVWV